MLLVTAEQVKYCQVTYHKNNQRHITEGMSYGNKLFTKINSFPKPEKHTAIERAKFVSVENKGYYLVILVEETDKYDIWQENDHVKIKSSSQPNINIAHINLEELVTKMRNVGGIRIEDRRHKLRTYHRCFVGKEVVAWLIENLKLSHNQAILLGQKLMDEKWIHHVTNDHKFKDEYLFYRFYWDEKSANQLLNGNAIKKYFS
ncbi:MAG: mechanosensitive ion channel protein [Sphaerospermopsis sp. SIO1G2]|nr:mechanosensitive ion channel protein [Sphaerospermopsis sp. SIO1G1]NET72655.1 mechanosensitive ion channel protein [Sphaerospermopsis sp. SIO1G2]